MQFDGLEAKTSQIPKAGLGLYAIRDYQKGDVICEYAATARMEQEKFDPCATSSDATTNISLSTSEAMKVADKSYLMRLGPQVYVNLKDDLSVAARYINDCRNPALYNVCFDKLAAESKAKVVATRNIHGGEELFVDYGKMYWSAASFKPEKIPVATAQQILINYVEKS